MTAPNAAGDLIMHHFDSRPAATLAMLGRKSRIVSKI